MDKQAIIEASKSFLRGLYFSIVGAALSYLSIFLSGIIAEGNLGELSVVIGETSLPVGVVIAAGLAALVKLIDRYIHKSESESNGLAPSFLQR